MRLREISPHPILALFLVWNPFLLDDSTLKRSGEGWKGMQCYPCR